MRHTLIFALTIAVATNALASSHGPDEGYNGPGVVTTEGVPGLFINPTTGNLAKGQFTAQYCVLTFESGTTTLSAWNAFAAVGVTDWLHVGALFFDVAFQDNVDLHGGPFAQVRVLTEQEGSMRPEISAGAIFREGDDDFRRRTIYAAASKGVHIDSDVFKSFRPTVGFRQYYEANSVDDGLFWFGVDLELPSHIHVIGEVNTKPDGVDDVPWSVGLQLRHPAGPAFSLGYVEPFGTLNDPGIFVGIGFGWE